MVAGTGDEKKNQAWAPLPERDLSTAAGRPTRRQVSAKAFTSSVQELSSKSTARNQSLDRKRQVHANLRLGAERSKLAPERRQTTPRIGLLGFDLGETNLFVRDRFEQRLSASLLLRSLMPVAPYLVGLIVHRACG